MNVPPPNEKPAERWQSQSGLKSVDWNNYTMNLAYNLPEGQLPGVDLRPTFSIETGTTNSTADEIVRHLSGRGVNIYRRYDGKLFEARHPIGVPATQALLRRHLEHHCRFQQDGKPCDPPGKLVSAVQASTQWTGVRPEIGGAA